MSIVLTITLPSQQMIRNTLDYLLVVVVVVVVVVKRLKVTYSS